MKMSNIVRYGALLVIFWWLLIPLPVTAQQAELEEEIIEAIYKSDVSAIDIWIAKGGDINLPAKSKNTLLMLAVKIGDRPLIEYLMSNIPDVDFQNKAGATALMLASKYGHTHIVDILLENGADPTIKNNSGHTASHFALAYKHYEIYKKLEEAVSTFNRQS